MGRPKTIAPLPSSLTKTTVPTQTTVAYARAQKRAQDVRKSCDPMSISSSILVNQDAERHHLRSTSTRWRSFVHALRDHDPQYQFDARRKCFVYDSNDRLSTMNPARLRSTLLRTCRGIAEQMHRKLWPTYKPPKKRASADALADLSERVRKSKKHGLQLGTLVHRQIEAYIKLPYETFRAQFRYIHRFTYRLLQTCAERNWVPVASEVPIGIGRYATAIDVIAIHRETLDMVVIELKTGSDFTYDTAGGKTSAKFLRAPLHALANSPRNHHQLQLASQIYVLGVSYGIRVIDTNANIMHVDHTDRVSVYPLDPLMAAPVCTVFQSVFALSKRE